MGNVYRMGGYGIGEEIHRNKLVIHNIQKLKGKPIVGKGYTYVVGDIVDRGYDYEIHIEEIHTLKLLVRLNKDKNHHKIPSFGCTVIGYDGMSTKSLIYPKDIQTMERFIHRLSILIDVYFEEKAEKWV